MDGYLHIDDLERIHAYQAWFAGDTPPDVASLDQAERRLLRMAISPLTTVAAGVSLEDAPADLWLHPQVLRELCEMLALLPERLGHLTPPIGLPEVPLRLHACYTRTEILAAFGIGNDAKPPEWREGVRWDPGSQTDIFAFTLDKSEGNFSPTTRYRDYALNPELIHWESQSTTSTGSPMGQRYINHVEQGTNIVLFARMTTELVAVLSARPIRLSEGQLASVTAALDALVV